jgi:hydroxylysine kinase
MLRELTEPFVRVTPAEASGLLREHYGLEATALELLETERDDSFHVTASSGEFVLKVAHPLDDPALVAMQTAAMEHAAAKGIVVQRIVRTLDGQTEAVHDGRIARVITWLDGGLLLHASPDRAQVTTTGAVLGRLAAALADFDHPGAHRTFAWDLQAFPALRGLSHPEVTDAVFDTFDALDLAALPHQVVHNDFHPGNVLVDADDPRYVVGVLDFGDAVYGPRILDLGLSLAYLVPETGSPADAIAPFVAGYESANPLLQAERDALRTLIAARLVQRIVLPPLLSGDAVDRALIARMTRTLQNLLTED